MRVPVCLRAGECTVEAEYFQLYKRARHVFTEALRVIEFREVCLRANATAGEGALPADTLAKLGELMDQSHESCSTLCESSCPEVDALCRLAKDAAQTSTSTSNSSSTRWER